MTRGPDSTARRSRRRRTIAFLAGLLAIAAVGLGIAGWHAVVDRQELATIHVNRALRGTIAADFALGSGRPPAESELDAAIAAWVRDEVFYREAVREGLAGGEAEGRAQVVGRLERAIAANAGATPTDAELGRWLAAHPDRFGADVDITFDQVRFSSRSRAIVGKTLLGGGADWGKLGDGGAAPPTFEIAPRGSIARTFGEAFADSAARLSPDSQWQGPLESTLGWHLVRVREKVVGAVPPLTDVRARVEADWRANRARTAVDAAYREMLGRYTIRMEP